MLHSAPKQPRGSAASSAVSHSLDDWLCGRSGGAGSGGTVAYEPVSSLIFPVFREITGKISKNADENRILRALRSCNSISCEAFP